MDQPGVVIVMLRRPRRCNPKEMRSDPFWELGSFGSTGCHNRSLMNPAKADLLVGLRMAFVQGGPDGIKLVSLSPPIKIKRHEHCCEAKWKPADMPFRYDSAVLIVNNDGSTELPALKASIRRVDRTTWMGKFTSAFRSRRRPLREKIGVELMAVYEKRRTAAGPEAIAADYSEALPWPPPLVDPNRKRTYEELLSRGSSGRCKRSRGHCRRK